MKKIIAIAIVLCLVLVLTVHCNSETEPMYWREYTVCDGDTICDISKNITPNSEDYRKTQFYILEKNNLENAMIYVNQKILIPLQD